MRANEETGMGNPVVSRVHLRRNVVIGEWRRLCNEEHYALWASRNIIWVIKKTEMGRACSPHV